MPSISFIFRPSSKVGDHPGSLYLRIIHRRKVKAVTIPGHLYRREWDAEAQAVVYPENDPVRTDYLEKLEQAIAEARHMAEQLIGSAEKQGRCTLEELIAEYRLHSDNGRLLSFAELLARGLEREGQYRTAAAYRTVSRGLVKFNGGNDILLSQLNASLVKAFESYLKKSGKAPNTTSYYMRNLRAIYNKAVRDKRIHARRDPPFAEVFTGVRKTRKRALTVVELNRLYTLAPLLEGKDMPPGSPERQRMQELHFAWKLFFFCFHARGMCFVDMAYLKKEDIRDGVMRYYRKKTGGLIEVKVTREMKRIIDSFSLETASSPYIFPIVRDEGRAGRVQYETALHTQNRRLRELAAMAGIEKGVSTHVARHSWATVGKLQNLPLGVISEGLGHASEKVTGIYLDSFELSVMDDANRMIAKAVKLGRISRRGKALQ